MKLSVEQIGATLIKGWKSSLNFFEPKELTTMGLVSANTTLRATTLLLKYFSWWLLLWGLWIDLYVDGTTLFGRFTEYVTPLWYSIGMGPRWYIMTLMAITFVVILSVRASLEAKQPAYYLTYVPRLLFFAPFFLFLPHIFAAPIFLFATFFLLDGPNSPKGALAALYNGAVVCAYYLPYVVCMGAVHGLLYNIHSWFWGMTFVDEYHFVAYLTKYMGSILLYTFFAAMVGAFYQRVVKGNSSNRLFWRVRRT